MMCVVALNLDATYDLLVRPCHLALGGLFPLKNTNVLNTQFNTAKFDTSHRHGKQAQRA